ncbi:MAG: 2-isopropylmalate synthase [Myxococcales bacterium]|nr:2-isopropylmalate synthase [Myxococcales bacterium]
MRRGLGHGQQLVYDWNTVRRRAPVAREGLKFYDETLRDGIQGPSIQDPSIEAKLRILELEESLGIDCIDLGLPGAGPRAVEDVTRLARHLVDNKMSIQPSCAARTHINDIRPIAEISQKVGIAIEVMAFLGTSPIRQLVENWDLDRLMALSGDAIAFAAKEGLPVTFVTEDTIRSRPDTLQPLFLNAIEKGARRLCLCDTVGHATPDGVRNLIDWTQCLVAGTGEEVGIDWHGHNDRGLGVVNTIFAAEYGADRIHGTALGIGERVGNAALDQVLLNFKLMGEIDNDLSNLVEWCQVVAEATGVTIPPSYPLMGEDAFRTATGVHASAVIKAKKRGDDLLADMIYSGVPAGWFGKQQSIEIGHMSGLSNVHFWLEAHGIADRPGLAEHVLEAAKSQTGLLSESTVRELVAAFPG